MRWPTIYEYIIAACFGNYSAFAAKTPIVFSFANPYSGLICRLFNAVNYGLCGGGMMGWARNFSSRLKFSTVSAVSTVFSMPAPLQNFDMRVLPLGDSITWGFHSSDGNGYRGRLYDCLAGNNVTMVGSVRSGNMQQNRNEGHNGAIIDLIASFANISLPEQPSIILLHAGTNDVFKHEDPAGAPARLAGLIDNIFETCPGAVLLVAQIIASTNQTIQADIDTYNAAIPEVVKQRSDAGMHVLIVDMSHTLNTSSDYSDFLHPNDAGYAKMGMAWSGGIMKAAGLGWIGNAIAASRVKAEHQLTAIAAAAVSSTPVPAFAVDAMATPFDAQIFSASRTSESSATGPWPTGRSTTANAATALRPNARMAVCVLIALAFLAPFRII